jgi:glucokinase
MELVLAADIGGTKMAAGVVRADGALLSTRRIDTQRGVDGDALYQRLHGLLLQALEASGVRLAEISALGIGCGGPMTWPEGLVSPLNIPAWRDFPLRPRLEADFGRRTLVDNDAKVFALGEHWLGGGRGSLSFMAMVVSTGVGGGIVQNGRLVDGAHGNAGHIGHIVVFPKGPRCACGAQGCLEAVASGTNLARQARTALATGVASRLPPEPTARDLEIAADQGDRLSRLLFRRAGIGLGRAIASATALFDLDRVVVGGGVSQAARFFLPALERELRARARLGFARDVEVQISAGTGDATLAGAARLVLNRG